ncbi:MAG: type III PLP-dependent enzyme [Arenicella sp.]
MNTVAKRPITLGAKPASAKHYQKLVAEHGSPLLVFDPDVLRQQYLALQNALPGVALYYAVKAHPDEHIISVIDELGGGFDVASKGEMDLLLTQKVAGRHAIHTHPIKKDQEIKDALRFGATTFVVDNLNELNKLLPYRSRVGILLRISFRSSDATVDLSKKFGCDFNEASDIVKQASTMGIHIKGLSFHVGSQCETSTKHVEAIQACGQLMSQLNQELTQPMATLDIGGGFPADYAQQGFDIHSFCAPIREALKKLPSDWHLLAEPGRYLIAPAVTSITSVTGKAQKGNSYWYYLDDGVYGSYSGQIFDHATYPLQVLKTGNLFPSALSGPTCDSIDMVAENIELPELDIGDLVIGHQMGAYTAATKTHFNSLPNAKFICL